MHGRPRKAPTAGDAAASAAKAAKLRDLQTQVIHNHHNGIYTAEARGASLELLEINPEVPYGWNYRKLALIHNLREAAGPDAIRSLIDEELGVVEIALKENPKSYGAWHHRKWVLGRRSSPANFDHESCQIDQLLEMDPRNFHAWNYHRFIAAMKDVPEADELQFTMDKINHNFSNYSAWHNRSTHLSRLLKRKALGYVSREEILTKEYDLVHQALFTDPTDQSGWFYYLWLLDQTVAPDLLLVSSWPVNGSDWVLSNNGSVSDHKLFPSTSSNSCYSLQTGAFPIILYFNQAVKGINSSTVIVKSAFFENEDLIWKPLSTKSLGEARCWVTYLKIPDFKSSSSKAYSVEVTLGHSPGIASLRGSHYSHPLLLKFNIKLNYTEPEQTGQEFAQEPLAWDYSNVWHLEESLAIISFDQLRITEDHVAEPSKWHLETLSNEITLFDELREENCKFVMLTLARLYNAYGAMVSHTTLLWRKMFQSGEVLQLFDDLIKLDPSHKGYYEDERSLVSIDQVTSDKESLMKHCWHFNKLNSSDSHLHGCLRLDKLSLTRIAFMERLLWVQILDLSHNELRSIEGLEALQLLSCLNLSNNRISSFTALEPLKLLISLKILNISFNEIGAHPVDSTRYLCPSPLSQRKVVDWDIEGFQKDKIKVADHWEAILLFNDLHLTQLDVEGNAVVGESLKVLLMKAVPTLNWLDSERLERLHEDWEEG